MLSSKNAHTLLVGMQNDTVTLEDILVVSYKIKHTFTIQSSNYSSSIHQKELKTYVHSKT